MMFAHYLVTNQDYQDNSTAEAKIRAYMKEIQQAQAIGIDGFALDVGSWLTSGAGAEYYIAYSSQMFEAAARLNSTAGWHNTGNRDSGFKLMFSADFCCGNQPSDVEDMMRGFVNYDRFADVYFRHDGKYVLTTFSGDALGTATWQMIKSDLATGANPSTGTVDPFWVPTTIAGAGKPSNAPVNIFLVPAFFDAFGGETPTQSQIQAGFNIWRSTVDGLFYWGIAGVPGGSDEGWPDQIPSSEAYASVLHSAGKLYMADGNPPVFNFTPTDQNCAALIGSGTDPIGIYTYSPARGSPIQYNDEYYSTGFLRAPRCGGNRR